jgi:hypothetical protein
MLIIVTNSSYTRVCSSYQAPSWLLPIVTSKSATPETSLLGHPWYITSSVGWLVGRSVGVQYCHRSTNVNNLLHTTGAQDNRAERTLPGRKPDYTDTAECYRHDER